MKFQKLFTYLFALLLITTLAGCDKDDKDKEPSKRDLLTAGEWRGFAVFINGMDITRELQEDEEYPFDVTKFTFKFDKAGTYLDSYNGATDNGTWEFANNEQSILFDKATTKQTTVSISKLTATEFYFVDKLDEAGDFLVEFRFNR